MELYSPWVLLLLVLAPIAAALALRRTGRANLRFSTFRDLHSLAGSWRVRLRPLPAMVRMICIILLVVALARPRQGSKLHRVTTRGVAMELVVDRSSSMEAEMDYAGKAMNRLDVVKRVLADFVKGGKGMEGRTNDLLGLITFAGYAQTACPLVQAPDALTGFLDQTQIVTQRKEDGTAIGDAIALAAARLEDSTKEIARRNEMLKAQALEQDDKDIKPDFEIESKVIVLLTDGRNNAGELHPLEAAKLATDWGIKIYPIGIGSGEARQRMQGIFGNFIMPSAQTLNEPLLQEIAKRTGGFYARADDAEALRKITKKIDTLEKSKIESIEYSQYEERFFPFALAALIAVALEILLASTVFRKIP